MRAQVLSALTLVSLCCLMSRASSVAFAQTNVNENRMRTRFLIYDANPRQVTVSPSSKPDNPQD